MGGNGGSSEERNEQAAARVGDRLVADVGNREKADEGENANGEGMGTEGEEMMCEETGGGGEASEGNGIGRYRW